MKVVDLIEKQADKNGEVTIKSIIEDLQKGYENKEMKSLICVIESKDNEILLSFNQMSQLKALGLLECGKQNVINDMYD